MKTLCHYISELTHGDKSREFLNKPVNNLSLTANDGGGAISIVATKGLSLVCLLFRLFVVFLQASVLIKHK